VNSVLLLLMLSAASGFAVGKSHFSWRAILATGLVLAPLSAAVLRSQGFGAHSGISVIAACLMLNQIAYLIGAARGDNGGPSQEGLPHNQADDVPRDGRDNDIRRENYRQQSVPIHLGQN
jgi:hypothetical protein